MKFKNPKKKQQGGVMFLHTARTATSLTLRSSSMGTESLRPPKYTLYHKLEEREMLPLLDARIDALFAAGAVDEGNANALNGLLIAVLREALCDLGAQELDHLDAIRRISVKRLADRADVRRARAQRELQRAQLQAEMDALDAAVKNAGEVLL